MGSNPLLGFGRGLGVMGYSLNLEATISWDAWESISARLRGGPLIVETPTLSYVGEPSEQRKLMIKDPSGNLIEIKAYRQPDKVLGSLAH